MTLGDPLTPNLLDSPANLGRIRAWDLETQTAVRWGQKASPWHPDNYVVVNGCVDTHTGDYTYGYHHGRPEDGWLAPTFDGCRILAGFNVKFDLLHGLVGQPKNTEAFRLFLAGGGMLWDCQLAEYLLKGMSQENQMLSLEEVSVRYGGTLKHDEVKALWEAGVNTSDIPEPLLRRYAAGGVNPESKEFEPGDIQNTATIFNGQWAKAKAAGMLPLIVVNMRAYAFTVVAKLNGMHVDTDIGHAQAKVLAAEIADLRVKMDLHVAGLPFTFNWGSPNQRSALLFGGKVPYEATEFMGFSDSTLYAPDEEVWWCPERDGETPPAGWKQAYTPREECHVKLVNGKTMELLFWEQMKYAPDGTVTEPECFKSGKNAGQPKTCKVKVPDLSKPKKRKCRVEHTMPGMVKPRAEWRGSEPGVYSTDSEVIEALEHSGVPFLKDYAVWQKMQKDLGTYYLTVDSKGKQKGMLTLVDELTSLIHGELSMCTTITGRLSASKPNTQNLPKSNEDDEKASRVKEMFTSRWGPEGVIIQDDYSSLEVYAQANLTLDQQLLEDLRGGLDLHVVRLSAWKEVEYDYAFNLAKGVNATAEWKSLRTDAKVFSFQRAYGAGAQTISDGTGISVPVIEELIAAEEKRWPQVSPYYEGLTQEIKRNREPGGRFIPHPAKPTIMCQLGSSWYRAPDGKLYTYKEHPAPEWMLSRKGASPCSFSPTEIRNYIVQGTGAEVAKAAMALIVYEWAKVPELFYRAPIINQVHDAVYADAHPDVKARAAAVLHACMLEASTVIKRKLGWNIAIDYPAEIQWGPSMAAESLIPDSVLARVPAVQERIRATI